MSSSASGSSDEGQLLVLAAIILAISFVALTMITQDVANTGFDTVREEARSLVREYDNAKDRFGTGLAHLSNHGNHSDDPNRFDYLVQRGFDRLKANYTELEASRRTHLEAELVSVSNPQDRRAEAEVDLVFEDEFTRVNETVTFPFDLYLADDWWDTRWDFRIPVSVDTRLLARHHYGVELTLNLTKARERADSPGKVEADSIQVVRVQDDGTVVGNVTRGVQKLPGFDNQTDARVMVVWDLGADVPQQTTRYYHVYFDEDTPTAPPRGVLNFADSFEDGTTLGSDWSPSGSSTDDTHAHSGNRSWKADGGETPSHFLSEEFDGVVDVWYYDEDPNDLDVDAWMEVHVNNTNNGTTLSFGLGADQGVGGGRNYSAFLDNAASNPQFQDTHFPRSEGWHRFTFAMNATRMHMYIDKKRVLANQTLAPYKYLEVEMVHGGGTADVWFDDVRIYEGVSVSRVHPVFTVQRWPHRR